MIKRVALCLLAVMFVLSMAGMVIAADTFKGTITSVERKSITIKTDSGDKTFSMSSKRTNFKGAGGASDLKAGQNVSITTENGEEASVVAVQ